MWYAIYREADGTLASCGTVKADPLPEGLAFKEFARQPSGFSWNPETLSYDVPIPPPPFRVRSSDLMLRFATAERIAARAAEATDPIVADFFDLLRVAGTVNLRDPNVTAGLDYLVSQGLLTAERRAEIGATD